MSKILTTLSALPLAIQVPSGWNFTERTPSLWSWNVQMCALLVTSHSLQVVSSEPEAIRRVSGENMAVFTQLVCALIVNMNRRSCNWNTFTFLSSDPDSKREPSSDRLTDFTGAEWLLMTWEKPSTLLDQTRMV